MSRKHKRITRLAIDSTGLGMQMAETMAKEFPGRVDEVNLESHRRHEICMIFKDKVENSKVYFPDDAKLFEDFSAPTLIVAANGNIRVRVPEFENAEGETSHADEFMAGVMGVSAGEGAVSEGCCEPPEVNDFEDGYRRGRR